MRNALSPVGSSKDLYARLQEPAQTAELYTYRGDNHNISANPGTAAQRSVEFFDLYVRENGS